MIVIYSILVLLFSLFPLLSNKNKNNRNLGFAIMFLYLFFISAFRGDFTADYSNYKLTYEFFRDSSFSVFCTPEYKVYYVEKGYGLINYLLSRFLYDPQSIIILTSGFIIYVYYSIGKNVDSKFLYILLLINIGPYFQSFNIVRQALAASIFMYGYKYIKKGDLLKYCLTILGASTIHITSIFMLPFYYFLRMRINFKNLLIQLLIILLVIISFDTMFQSADAIIFSYKYGSYMASGEMEAKDLVVPIAVVSFVAISIIVDTYILNKKDRSDCSMKEQIFSIHQDNAILFNGTIYWLLMHFMSFQFFYAYRYIIYFSLYTILAVVKSVEKITDYRMRLAVNILLMFFLSIYYIFFGQYFGEYIFCF